MCATVQQFAFCGTEAKFAAPKREQYRVVHRSPIYSLTKSRPDPGALTSSAYLIPNLRHEFWFVFCRRPSPFRPDPAVAIFTIPIIHILVHYSSTVDADEYTRKRWGYRSKQYESSFLSSTDIWHMQACSDRRFVISNSTSKAELCLTHSSYPKKVTRAEHAV